MDVATLDLPEWMRQARRGVDWGLLLVIVFSLLACWGFITAPGLSRANASENYVFRTADYATALQEGRLYPRWSANAFGGYGAPIPHYYPPGAPYLAALIQILITDDAVVAVRLTMILAVCLCGASVYMLVMRCCDPAAGILAAVLYVYSPFVGLVAPQVMGELPVVLGLALLPTLLWSANRLLARGGGLDLLLVTLSSAALFLTHVPLALTGLGLTSIAVMGQQRRRHSHPFSVIVACLLGIGVASPYWVPALLELDAVHWNKPFQPRGYMLTLAELLSLQRQLDPGEMIPKPQFTLGLASMVCALAGLLVVIRQPAKYRFQTLFLMSGIAFGAAAVTVRPSAVWLLGPISLCLAIGGSAMLHLRERFAPRWWRLALPLTLIIVWVSGAPIWLAPQRWEPFGSSNDNAQVQYEQSGYGIAVLPADAAAPSTISPTLISSRWLIEGYLSNAVNKIAPGQVSVDVVAAVLDHNTHSDRFQLRIDSPTTLDFLTAYFPGWRATLDGRITPLVRSAETGLIRVEVPLTRGSELLISLEATPVRTGAWLLSGAFLAIALTLTVGRMRRRQRVFDDLRPLTTPEVRLLMVLLACFGLALPLTSTPGLPFSLRAEPGYRLRNSNELSRRTDGGVSLNAFNLDRTTFRPGATFNLTLFWQAQRLVSENYQVEVYLLNTRDGTRWNQTPLHHPGGYPARRWNTSQYVRDEYEFRLLPTMTPGEYLFAIEVYTCRPDCASGGRLTFFDETGRSVGPVFNLPLVIQVTD